MSRILLLLVGLAGACGQQMEVRQSLQRAMPESVDLGAPIDLVVTRSWPAGWRAAGFDAGLLEPFEVEERGSQRVERGGRVSETHRLRLRAWTAGELALQLAFSAQDPETGVSIAAVPVALSVQVRSLLPVDDSGRIEDAPPLAPGRSPWGTHPLAALAVVAFYAGVLYLVARSRQRRKATAVESWDAWDEFARIQALPVRTEEQRGQVRAAIRELLRELEPGRAWGGPELAARVARRYSLPDSEATSLRTLIRNCEAALFDAYAEAAPVELELDELAEVLHAVEDQA